jgi:hypothetical protein
MRFGSWNIRSLCRVGTIKSVVGELQRYKYRKGKDIKQWTTIHFAMEKGMLITN